MALILVVDDRPINREFLTTLLGYAGHDVLHAADGAEALAIVRAKRPSLVISDIMMPTMTGVEFANNVRADAEIAGVSIIFYTATYRVTDARAMAAACGVSTVLTKPAEPQEILDAVAASIGTSSTPLVQAGSSPGLPNFLRSLTDMQRHLRNRLDEVIEARDTASASAGGAPSSLESFQSFTLRVAALLELDVALTSERDREAMLGVFCRGAQDIMHCRYAALGILDESGNQLQSVATRGLPDSLQARLAALDPVSGIFGHVLSSGKPHRVSADGDDATTLGLADFHPPVRSLLIAPLPVRSVSPLTGWIYFAEKLDDKVFDEEDERFAVTMAAQFALAYGNLQMYDEIQQHAARLEVEVAARERTAKALTESEMRFRQIADNIHAIFFLTDPDSSRVHYVSPGYEEITGRTCASLYAKPQSWTDAIHPDDRDDVVKTLIERSVAGLGAQIDYRIVRPDGTARWLHVRSFPIRDEFGKPYRTAGIATDITETMHAKDELRESNRRFQELQDNIELISVMLDLDGKVTYCNDYFLNLTGWKREELLNQSWFARFASPQDDEGLKTLYASLLAGASTALHNENEILTSTGERRLVRWNNTLLRSATGELAGVASIGEDVTDQRKAQAALAHSLTHDVTTGLPRFVLIEDFLEAAFVEAAARESRVIVLYVDMDRFHVTNETRGRAVGDHVLRVVGERLLEVTGQSGRVAHISGDEFAIVLKDAERAQDQVEFGELIRARVEEPIPHENQQIYVTCSVGVSCFPDNGSSSQELLRQAESAMLQGKDDGRNTVVAFSNEQKQELEDRFTLSLYLHDAVRAGEFLLHYQPRINGQDWRVSGFESLLRWQSPRFGFLLPGRFLRVAEDLGLMVEIGRFVLESACRQAREWIDAGVDDFAISINVSPAQMRPAFVDEVRAALAMYKLPSRYLELELVESMMIGNFERVAGIMRALKALGIKLSLDDFGTGYSSLNYLRQFPIDTLKIDQTFVRDINTDAGAAGVCRAIITLGHQLGMSVLAEGVETAAQVGYLRRNECDLFQGYYFCKPVPAEKALVILRNRYLAHEGVGQPVEQPTLLLVDDEENILNALVRMLRRDGYRILTATGAEDALDVLGRHDVQVVISDQRMPGVSGTELLSKVKDMYPHTVRMVLSGYTDLAAVTAAINQGSIYKFLTKPWNDEELRLQIRDAFRIAHRPIKSRTAGTA